MDDYIDMDRQRGLMCRDSNDTIPSFGVFAILHPEELLRFAWFVLRVVLRGYEISWLKVWLQLAYVDLVSQLLVREIHHFAGDDLGLPHRDNCFCEGLMVSKDAHLGR